ncbi:acyl coA binding protein domain-containing protein [Purpureocillium lilacinum]|uniref:Acyl coA binding protein domain-containing protein n=1 Tax=Purpureocillium lilacinum TaxID=33203 RepID=A0A179HBT7_PURLI|nr:acyl coA binding protein domain-containing protein [Purpureocillium lilacinum]KAK4087586.1 hypothetical protein Purlil1_8176 [Purpureocillium lilacinum]OAQ86973.1 acyl coA binding protein domain-containing protein [Purpureocillium lilacinum]OAQ94936.1 acyl coA binding protein domain-containing protein [Purpureocillium lilacinum]PWI70377.1 hypothetical protein PCL_12776 [Purpureocillium lilacinum]GJN66804.1 hypothetical protein PLICBS_000826 [Purpureocillium lilacinum]
MAQTEAFQKAVVDSKKLTSKPSNDELLDLYALYKVAIGEDISKAAAPGMFDLKASAPVPPFPIQRLDHPEAPPYPRSFPLRYGKAKKNAWQKVVDEGITAEQAQERYVELVEKLKVSCGYDENKEPEAVGN